MEYLDKNEIRNILNLKGSDLIQEVTAERQLEVIRRGFNLLHQPGNNALYIADEVGLGKTLTMIVAAQEMKSLGIVQKPMILALKANVAATIAPTPIVPRNACSVRVLLANMVKPPSGRDIRAAAHVRGGGGP